MPYNLNSVVLNGFMEKTVDSAEHRNQKMRKYASAKMAMYLQKHLSSDEAVVWMSQPLPSNSIKQRNYTLAWFVIGFAIWLGLGSLSNYLSKQDTTVVTTYSSPEIIMSPLFSLIFSALCLIPIFLIAAAITTNGDNYRKRHLYAITTRRLIILKVDGKHVQVRSYGKRQITLLKIKNLKQDGSGDIIFVQDHRGLYPVEVGFIGVPRVQSVKRTIIDIFGFNEHDYW